MSLIYHQFTDEYLWTEETNGLSAAYSGKAYGRWVSPSSEFQALYEIGFDQIVCFNNFTETLVYDYDLRTTTYTGFDGYTVSGFSSLAVDDEGATWGYPDFGEWSLVLLDSSSSTPQYQMTWDGYGNDASENKMSYLWAFTMPDSSVFVVGRTSYNKNAGSYYIKTGTKGVTTTMSEITLGAWNVRHCFQDDNGDVWVAGVQQGNDTNVTNKVYFKRITDVASSTYPSTVLEFTVPTMTIGSGGAASRDLLLDFFFDNGAAVGFLSSSDPYTYNYGIRAELDGSGDIVYTDNSAAPWMITRQIFPADMEKYYIYLYDTVGDNDRPLDRKIYEVNKTTMALTGVEYDLADWGAADTDGNGDDDEMITYGMVYVHALNAFAGSRYYYSAWPDHFGGVVSDYFIYFLGAADGGGGAGGDPTIRVWGFSLDGHDFYVLQLGDSETFVYDLTTQTWSRWISPDDTRWRPTAGRNWVGIGADTIVRGGTDVVAGDYETGTLYVLSATGGYDDGPVTGSDYFQKIVMGGVKAVSRELVPCGAVTLDLATGNPALTGASITLDISDDAGHTWINCGDVTLDADEFNQVIEWRSLGSIRAPGRLFRFTDEGASVRIDGADLR